MQAQESNAVLTLENLTVARKNRIIVSDLTLSLDKGIFALRGSNGSGKTTLLSAMAGVLAPSAGTVVIDGIELARDPVGAKHKLAFLPETVSIYPFITGSELLSFVAGVRDVADTSRLDDMVGKFELGVYRHMRFDKMSQGTQRKFMLIATLVSKVDLYLLDEPTNSLDAKSLEVLAQLIKEASERSLVILSCHDENFLGRLNHKELFLRDGHVECA